jgi:iron complex outermembrane receptor protein
MFYTKKRKCINNFCKNKLLGITMLNMKSPLLVSIMCCLYGGYVVAAQDDANQLDKELAYLRAESYVYSAGKKQQKISEVAGAAFVISQEDIKHSGATTIADALRLAPGVQVARYSSHAWAITMRGFNSFFSANLLVMIDGRSVYNTEFSGVYWDITDTMLADIERIEVIRGPGGTLWGANAVNGVINIITKKAKDTQGGLLVARAGNEEKGEVDLRYGGVIDEASNTYYRVYTKNLARDSQRIDNGRDDHWSKHQLGFKVEGEADEAKTQWIVQGDAYSENLHEGAAPLNTATRVEGANVLSRMTKKFSSDSELRVQAYYDYSLRNAASIKITDNVFDLEVQHRYRFSDNNEFMSGFGYRIRENASASKVQGTFYSPETRREHLFSAFLQDEIALIPKTLRLTLGSKFEHNVYTGFEVQPSARLLWSVDENSSVWASVSRAVRTPSRLESDISITSALSPQPVQVAPGVVINIPVTLNGSGNKNLKAENTLAYELGFRQQVTAKFSYDVSGFYNHYRHLRGSNPQVTLGFPIIVATQALNNMRGNGYGVELSSTWKPFDWWQLKSSYTYTKINLRLDQNAQGTEVDLQNRNPRHQVSLFSNMAFSDNWGLDLWLRYTDKINTKTITPVNAYMALDMRVFWQPIKQVELSLVGQNLIADTHYEFPQDRFNLTRSAIEKAFYGQVSWKF